MFGGNCNQSFNDIQKLQNDSFERLISFLNTQVSELKVALNDEAESKQQKDKILEEIEKFEQKNYIRLMQAEYQNSSENMYDTIKKSLKDNCIDEKDYFPMEAFGESTGITAKHLKNIQAPSVIPKIWQVFDEKLNLSEQGVTLESFFGISVNPTSNVEMFYFQKVFSIYNFLNFIGYYRDKKIKKYSRFVTSLSDASHAKYGSLTRKIFSIDKDFVMKVRAIFEFLDISTEVIYVTVVYENYQD